MAVQFCTSLKQLTFTKTVWFFTLKKQFVVKNRHLTMDARFTNATNGTNYYINWHTTRSPEVLVYPSVYLYCTWDGSMTCFLRYFIIANVINLFWPEEENVGIEWIVSGLYFHVSEKKSITISWHFTQCRIRGLNFKWNHTQLKSKPGTIEKNVSTIGPSAGIEPTPSRCRRNAPWQEYQPFIYSLAFFQWANSKNIFLRKINPFIPLKKTTFCIPIIFSNCSSQIVYRLLEGSFKKNHHWYEIQLIRGIWEFTTKIVGVIYWSLHKKKKTLNNPLN